MLMCAVFLLPAGYGRTECADRMPRHTTHDMVRTTENADTSRYTASDSVKAFIKGHETFRADAYRIKGERHMTVGWGHLMDDGLGSAHMTRHEADRLFDRDIHECEDAVNRLLADMPCRFSQGFIDGMVSLVYNCGAAGLKDTEFWSRLRRCRIDGGHIRPDDLRFTVAAVRGIHITMPGHTGRRYTEQVMMLDKK